MWPGIRSELVARTRWNKEELISCLVQLMYSNLVLPVGRRGNNSDVVVESYNLTMLSKRFTKDMKMTSLIDKLIKPR